MAELKHVGRVIGTGKKCIVAYRTLPGDAYNCLIVPTENLSDSYHDAIISLVESNAGQASYEFAEALARTNFPDGYVMLTALHSQNKLIKISTDQIEMLPTHTVSIRLSELNQIIAEQRGTTVDELSLKSPTKIEPPQETTTETKVEEPKSALKELLTPEQKAKHYRSEADRLSKEAASLRRQAEELVPTVKKSKTDLLEARDAAVDEAVAEALESDKVTTKKVAKAKVVNPD
jgi:hypothetical protein